MWVALVLVGAYVPSLLQRNERRSVVLGRFGVAAVLTVVMALEVLKSTPEPGIDVFHMLRQGARALDAGMNPYVHVVAASTGGAAATVPYGYPPGSLYLTWFSWKVLGDVRLVMLLGVLAAGFLARRELRKAAPNLPAILQDAPALMLWLFPKWPLIFQRSWVDPIALGLLAAFAYATLRGRKVHAAAILGLVLVTKQPMFWLLPLAFVLLDWKWKHVAVCVGTALALSAPLALANPKAFWYAVYEFHANLPARRDALSLSNLFSERFHVSVPAVFGFVAAAAVLVVFAKAFRKQPGPFFLCAALIYLVFYAFNKQAFINYYHFIAGLGCLSVAFFVRAPEAGPAGNAPHRQGQIPETAAASTPPPLAR